MGGLKPVARRLAAFALYYSGLLWIYAEFKLRGKALVLMYHRVLAPDADTFSHEGIIVSPDIFDRHIAFIQRHFRALTSQQFHQQLKESRFQRRACLITFDDGWADNAEHALPILRHHRVPAIVFVTTGYIGTRRVFWQEHLARLLFLTSRQPDCPQEVLQELNLSYACVMPDHQARRVAQSFVATLKQRGASSIDSLLQRIDKFAGPLGDPANSGADAFMTWDQVREVAQSGLVTIGSHAHSHTPLPNLKYDGALKELLQSREILAVNGVPTPDSCAYPNGNVDDSTADAARDSGFSMGFSTRKVLVSPGDDALQLGRINVHGVGTATRAEFLCRILQIL